MKKKIKQQSATMSFFIFVVNKHLFIYVMLRKDNHVIYRVFNKKFIKIKLNIRKYKINCNDPLCVVVKNKQ